MGSSFRGAALLLSRTGPRRRLGVIWRHGGGWLWRFGRQWQVELIFNPNQLLIGFNRVHDAPPGYDVDWLDINVMLGPFVVSLQRRVGHWEKRRG